MTAHASMWDKRKIVNVTNGRVKKPLAAHTSSSRLKWKKVRYRNYYTCPLTIIIILKINK